MRNILLVCGGVVALAACGPGGGKAGEQSPGEVAQEMGKLNFRPGQWEMTTEVLSANAPSLPPPAVRQMVGQKTQVAECMTAEEAQNPSARFLLGQKNMDCAYQGFSVAGGIMKGSMTCSMPGMPGDTSMQIQGKYSPFAYDIDTTMKAGAGGATMDVKARVSGRRTGECA